MTEYRDATQTDLDARELATGLDPRADALASFLGIDSDEVEPSPYGGYAYDAEGETWAVLTDEESDAAVVEYVRESVWAFNSRFLADETGLPAEMFAGLQDKCEDANDPILKVVESLAEDGLEGFAGRAVEADGRGHFLSQWDGEEREIYLSIPGAELRLYAYRTN